MAYSANRKPLELTALTVLATDDTFVVGDTSDTSEVVKSITKAALITDLSSSFATTAFVTTADNLKANLASPTFTGTVVLPAATVTNAMIANGAVANLSGTNSGNETGVTLAVLNAAATSKATPVGADSFPIVNSAAADAIGRVTFTNLMTFIGSFVQTVTGKRNQPRTNSTTTAATLAPDLTVANVYFRTTQTATLTISAPIGTPVIGETLYIEVSSVASQTLTINAIYIPFGAAFPAATTAGKSFLLTCTFNGTNWRSTGANEI